VALFYFFNVFTGTLLPAVVVIYGVGPIEYRFDFSLVWHVVACLATSDVLFYFSHQYLHRHMPQVHLFHHCCRRASFNSNALFDPLDLAVEFTGPVLSLIFLTLYVFRDPFAFLVGLGIITAWYL
jgi:hypothetical protein